MENVPSQEKELDREKKELEARMALKAANNAVNMLKNGVGHLLDQGGPEGIDFTVGRIEDYLTEALRAIRRCGFESHTIPTENGFKWSVDE